MTCPDCDREMSGDLCSCGYQAKIAAPAEKWIVRYCATPGCGVRIRERVGNQGDPRCKWCQDGWSYNEHGKPCQDVPR